MNKFRLFSRQVLVAFLILVTVCISAITLLDVNTGETRTHPGPFPANPLYENIQAEIDKIYLEATLSKGSYKFGEPITLNISISNHTSYDFVYMDNHQSDYEILIRENNDSELPLNGYRTLIKRSLVAFSRVRTLLKRGEVRNYQIVLNKTVDIGVGKYEIIAKRQLDFPGRKSLIDRLFQLNKTRVVDLESKPVKFEVIK